MPEPRWFHRAGVGSDGRIYVFAGRVQRADSFLTHGLGEYSLVIYNPADGVWTRGPAPPEFHVRNRRFKTRITRQRKKGTKIITERKRERVQVEEPLGMSLDFEAPNGGADRAGRIFWFARMGPVYFDPATGAWDQQPGPVRIQETLTFEGSRPLYDRLGSATATAAGPAGWLYLLGGVGRKIEAPKFDVPDRSPSELLRSVEVYDPATDAWSEAAPMLEARQIFSAAFGPDGRLYVFGGYTHVGHVERWEEDGESDESFEARGQEMFRRGRQGLDHVEAYDPETDTWTRRAPMPLGVDSSAAALGADGRIYVVGGIPSYSDAKATPRVQVYDPRRDSWFEGPPLREARQGHAVVATPDGRIWAIGGTNAYESFHPRQVVGGSARTVGGPLDSVEFLDTRRTK